MIRTIISILIIWSTVASVIALSVSETKPKPTYCKVATTNCITLNVDTIYIKAYGGLCLMTVEGDTMQKLADKTDGIFKDSVCDFFVIYHSPKPFKHP